MSLNALLRRFVMGCVNRIGLKLVVRTNQAHLRVATMCRLLSVSSSGYYAWRSRGRSLRAERDAARGTIRSIHKVSGGTYGVLRVHAELAAGGCRVIR